MPVSVLDSRIWRNIFGTEDIRLIFEDKSYAYYMITVEAALARAQSKIGIIPPNVGEEISRSCHANKLDFEKFGRETEVVGYPVLPLLRQMHTMCAPEVSRYLHWGATTQDIMDTASVLQMQDGLQFIEKELKEMEAILAGMAQKYRDTPMPGRTHLQQALPVTFGYKCAVYLSSIERHLERLSELKDRTMLVQFGGAAGTLASLGPGGAGVQVRRQLALELGLGEPLITWHVARDNMAEIVNFLALVGGTLGKIAYDVILMSSNEIGEVSEPFFSHRGASSTMPQKRNPISSEVVLAISKMLRANAGLALDAMVCDFERASGPWHLEWAVIPESFVLTCGALHQTNFCLAGLSVNEGAMLRNLASTRGLIVGEAVMMGLATSIGRRQAHDVVYDACRRSSESGRALVDILLETRALTDKVPEAEVRRLCDPTTYLGASGMMVDAVVARSQS